MPGCSAIGAADVAETAPHDGVSAAGHRCSSGRAYGGVSDCTRSLGRLTRSRGRSRAAASVTCRR